MTTKNTSEYGRFDGTMQELLKVPHSQIKAKLDAEKKAKEEKAGCPILSPAVGEGWGS